MCFFFIFHIIFVSPRKDKHLFSSAQLIINLHCSSWCRWSQFAELRTRQFRRRVINTSVLRFDRVVSWMRFWRTCSRKFLEPNVHRDSRSHSTLFQDLDWLRQLTLLKTFCSGIDCKTGTWVFLRDSWIFIDTEHLHAIATLTNGIGFSSYQNSSYHWCIALWNRFNFDEFDGSWNLKFEDDGPKWWNFYLYTPLKNCLQLGKNSSWKVGSKSWLMNFHRS